MDFLDFILEIGPGEERQYPVRVVQSPAGEGRAIMHFPFDADTLKLRLHEIEKVLLRAGGRYRRLLSLEEHVIQEFGQSLFTALFTGEVGNRYEVSRAQAMFQHKGLRLKFRIQPPELAALPWETLYDVRQDIYLSLIRTTPIVRYIDLSQSVRSLLIEPALRILGMVASPHDLLPLDVIREKQEVEQAVANLSREGKIELTWLEHQTWFGLQQAMRQGTWHIFHYIGHGGFDPKINEGFLAFTNHDGNAEPIPASKLGYLLEHESLCLALLNTCDGARSGHQDIFSSLAATLVRRGLPAVIAMQYPVTDETAAKFAQSFYAALTDGEPVDAAVTEGRKAMNMMQPESLLWIAPVLTMRAPDGVLFRLGSTFQAKHSVARKIDSYDNQGTIVFGKLTVNQQGLAVDDHTFFWYEIEDIYLSANQIWVKPWHMASLPVGFIHQTPNVFVLIEFVRRILAGMSKEFVTVEKGAQMITQDRQGSSYWTEFPETYRSEQVAILARWIAHGESGVVVGVSGTGKSNLVGFVTGRPEVICQQLPSSTTSYCFVHLDVNSLPSITTSNFYRGMLYALQEAAARIDQELAQSITQVIVGVMNWEDTMAIYFALQRAHDLLINRAGKKVVWLIDRFDEACRRLEAGTLNSLRYLRDHHRLKTKLAYVVFTRHPLARLRNPGEFDEFHEIMVANTCWVGAMVVRDAHWIARQMAERHQTTFSDLMVTLLIELTGGWPAFMKAACTELAKGHLSQRETVQTWSERLLAQPLFQRNCQEIWNDCSSAEQTVLTSIATEGSYLGSDGDAVAYLEKVGLVRRQPASTQRHIFSPIFTAFIRQQKTEHQRGITLNLQMGIVLRDGVPLPLHLAPLEYRLLTYLIAHTGELCEKDALIAHLWPDEKMEEGNREEGLAQLVKRLRGKIEYGTANHTYIHNVRGHGYRFVQPEA